MCKLLRDGTWTGCAQYRLGRDKVVRLTPPIYEQPSIKVSKCDMIDAG